MVITEKQIADGRVTLTVFIPLGRAIELEKNAKQIGISKNRLVNSCIDFALDNEDKLKIVETPTVREEGAKKKK